MPDLNITIHDDHCLWGFSRAFHRAISDGELQCLGDLLDEDVDWAIFGPVDMLPFLGARFGKAAVLDTCRWISDSIRINRFERESILLGRDSGASMIRYSLTTRDSDRLLSVRLAHFAHFRAGRLIRLRAVIDSFDLVEQLLGSPIHLPRVV